MKIFKMMTILAFCIGFLFCVTSCVVFVRDDKGNHKGWYKNSNNPHHPNSTNPGKSKDKHDK